MSLWDLVPGGDAIKKGLDVVGGVDGIKDKYNEASENEHVQSGFDGFKAWRQLGKVEGHLKGVEAGKINISAKDPSDIGEFVQEALNLINPDAGLTVDGQAGGGTVKELNEFIQMKHETEAGNKLFDKFEDLEQLTGGIEQLTGRHVQAIIHELREEDHLTKNSTELLGKLGNALHDIDDEQIQKLANEISPKDAPAVEPQSSLDSATVGQVAVQSLG